MNAKIKCVVDNNVKLSSNFWGEHGLSFLIENKEKILFDTGRTFEVLNHNLEILGEKKEDISKVFISHGHYDHTGGLIDIIKYSGAKLYAHPSIFDQKYKKTTTESKYIGVPFKKKDLPEIYLTEESIELSKNIYTTGEIERTFDFEKVSTSFLKKLGPKYDHDSIPDDQAIVIKTNVGGVVILGCNHSGLLNTIEHSKDLIGDDVFLVLGGTHLVSADENRISKTIDYLKKYGITLFGFHCTGDNASLKLHSSLGRMYCRGYTGFEVMLEFEGFHLGKDTKCQ
ncbi:MAG: 7,8-dihydropterin-6-methyl-4-(beta-D-ribofuranosyl)-aminobenzene-5'-phosphate synthase [Candidatus Methanofastidiosum methylothiophilum]|uniref:7, 8-dihydropterin-6-methyl-4-(Beta-D-ribofuranosyl)-aminobenzene-5'-phosphate synthase n=1 Tax=Candidatus Methanofastidiosum methylothiophilum TaxID=1705564 RepID=A0A150IYZ4_9EURY|nr:MAG: 7,8-dihydropterin-6-methyl-4-(beta-D-ribofuranosyl)-aminobenzene-5'-phosphate synthase [Candidatus Methanofastidiosum methylthiophilus]KYC47671.1 MAG: 7,8-dihydropterin-6-methyl-4-(beta-D-ribofuranosyl)-aminobenzene-5'-phosphate synthase [Candidatus Methanofastidiosum methylthiophilus]KYC50132.1 MAG: 7,8-dihydropterin-6-methyl-4-(beta-D-ribofuranosyl)-aminobenzene-5'-phosphate synthase [Candidatus Methanofastidiosum methylthiophilus]